MVASTSTVTWQQPIATRVDGKSTEVCAWSAAAVSDVEEHGLTLPLQADVEDIDRPAVPHLAARDQGLPPLRLLDDVEYGIGGIGCLLVAEVHPRRQAKIDPARHDPEIQVRRHRPVSTPTHDR